MAIKYYPLSRVKTNLKTSGGQYTLNGQSYKGSYYVTYKGEAFTGENPATGPNQPLEPFEASRSTSNSALLRKQSKLALTLPKAQATTLQSSNYAGLKQLTPYYPVVTDSDYKTGYITRYFAKKVNSSSYIIEISYTDWVTVTEDRDPSFEDYEAIEMFWQVTGPKNDKRVSQYQIIGGVYDTNKRVTEGKAKGFNGLVQYIGDDYTKYAQLTD